MGNNDYIEEYNKCLANNDFNGAEAIINILKEKNFFDKSLLKYYKKQVNELKFRNSLSDEFRNIICKRLSDGKRLMKYHKYYNAIKLFNETYYLTKDPIFLYYIGKCYYILKIYKSSSYYFDKYDKCGFEKLNKALFYKYLIHYKNENYINAKENLIRCTKVNEIIKTDFDLKRYYVNIDKKINAPKKENNILKLTSLVSMINQGKLSELNDYLNNSSLKPNDLAILKLELIEYLYKSGYSFVADKILKDIKKLSLEDGKVFNKKIEQINRNKKIWIKK